MNQAASPQLEPEPGPEPEPAPELAAVTVTVDAIVELYTRFNPEKLPQLDGILAKYRGREQALLAALQGKYGRR